MVFPFPLVPYIYFVCCELKRKRKTSSNLQQTETENGSLFSLIGKRLTVNDGSYFIKRAHLCFTVRSINEPSVELYLPGLKKILTVKFVMGLKSLYA